MCRHFATNRLIKEKKMSVQDYMSALKMGKREYNACMNKGISPYPPVMENIIPEGRIDSEVSLGIDQIPLRLVVGTCNASRNNAFARNFMPIFDWGSEFAAKWASLSDSQVNEGIRDPIKVYEYMNKFYVLEGNKRVSVLKYVNAVTVNAEVIRMVPKKSKEPEVKIYYEFMDFYKCTRLNDIYFSKVGSFPTLMKLVGIKKGRMMDEDAKKDFTSSFLLFKNAFEQRGGDRFDYPVGDAYLRFIHIHGYKEVKSMTPSEMSKNVAKTWEEFELLSEKEAVDLVMDPSSTPKKNILSYLLPTPGTGSRKLKVGFIYESTPQDSEWCYAHELGRQYIDETFGSQIETMCATNVKPDENDEQAIEAMINDKADIIFVTSGSMTMASLKMAIAHPEVKILNCSLNTSHKYIRTYYARMYEAKFLSGVIAGALTTQNKIGYVAQSPVYGSIANINAFALGAKMVNPCVKVYLEWSSVKDRDVFETFRREKIHNISDQDMITPQSTSRRFGLYNLSDEGNTKNLAMTVWHWGIFYEKLIQSIMSGSWKYDESQDEVKALNYWWGMSAGVVDLICSGRIPTETVRLVELMKKLVSKGELEPFAGKLYDQQGNLKNEAGNELSPEDIVGMDWLLDNVVGTIPKIDELEENAKTLVMAQGIGKN